MKLESNMAIENHWALTELVMHFSLSEGYKLRPLVQEPGYHHHPRDLTLCQQLEEHLAF
jgi:hypothetical protein